MSSISITEPAGVSGHPVAVPRTNIPDDHAPQSIRRTDQKEPFKFEGLALPSRKGDVCDTRRPCEGWAHQCTHTRPAVPPSRPTRSHAERLLTEEEEQLFVPSCDPPMGFEYGKRAITHMATTVGEAAPNPIRLLQRRRPPVKEGEEGTQVIDVTKEQWMSIIYILGGLLLLVASILAIVYR